MHLLIVQLAQENEALKAENAALKADNAALLAENPALRGAAQGAGAAMSAPVPAATGGAAAAACGGGGMSLDDALRLPLPDGWVAVESEGRPGAAVFENATTGELIGWVPRFPAALFEGSRVTAGTSVD